MMQCFRYVIELRINFEMFFQRFGSEHLKGLHENEVNSCTNQSCVILGMKDRQSQTASRVILPQIRYHVKMPANNDN